MANRILFVGFSVMSYLKTPLNVAAKARGITELVVSLEGHQVKSMSHLIDKILDWHDSEAVILDLTTPAIRKHLSRPHWDIDLDNIIQSIESRGRRVGLVHLYRSDVDFEHDELIDWCDAYCAAHDIMSTNVGKIVSKFPQITLDKFLIDDVHPSGYAAEYYAKSMVYFGQSVLKSNKLNNYEYSSIYSSAPFHGLLGKSQDEIIMRHGFPLPVVHLPEHNSILLDIPNGFDSKLILVGFHPGGGTIKITRLNGDSEIISTFDEHCYYQRIAPVWLTEPIRGSVKFEQLSTLPEVKLKKGIPYSGPRLGKLSHILLTRR